RGDFAETSLEVLGAEATYGPNARPQALNAREVVLKIGARHANEKALEILTREIAPAASSMAQGLTGFFAGRPNVQPVMRLFSFLWPKADIVPTVRLGSENMAVPFAASAPLPSHNSAPGPARSAPGPLVAREAPPIAIAGRRG